MQALDADVVVIGGGPAGSTTATLLAQRGFRVSLFEKARHPRFHIGESLLPANVPLFEQLGVAEEVRRVGMRKCGAQFVSHWDGREQTFDFGDSWNKDLAFSYQVRRADFDEILLRRAQAVGAEVHEGCRVRNVEIDSRTDTVSSVEVEMEDGTRREVRATYFVDASGRDTLLANKLGTKSRNRKHNSAALYGHFTGVERCADAHRAGDITIYWFDHGWFWLIPLSDGTTSVGAVVWPHYLASRKVPVRQFFLDTIAMCPPLAARLRHAELTHEPTATGNFSYSCDRTHGANYLLIGDAFTFIDPVFSSGVLMAMQGGFKAAETLQQLRDAPATSAQALRAFDKEMRHGPREFSWFIYRVTNPTMRELFLGPSNMWRMQEALLSLLAGDIYGKTPIWRSLRALKGIYYVFSLRHLRRTLRAMWARRNNIRPSSAPAA